MCDGAMIVALHRFTRILPPAAAALSHPLRCNSGLFAIYFSLSFRFRGSPEAFSRLTDRPFRSLVRREFSLLHYIEILVRYW